MQPSTLRLDEVTLLAAIRMIEEQPEERLRAQALCDRLLKDARPLTAAFKATVLTDLNRQRLYDLIEPMAERLIREGAFGVKVHKVYGQALIENDKLAAAECVVSWALAQETEGSDEWRDICGVIGRLHKQRFVTLVRQNAPRDQQDYELQTSIDWYKKGWPNQYHAINLLALARRVQRDGRAVRSDIHIQEAAEDLLEAIDQKQRRTSWDYAVALEACVALDRNPSEILQRANDYAGRRDVHAFELASSLRQYREIWQIDPKNTGGDLIVLLEAALFERTGGGIDLRPSSTLNAIVARLTGDTGSRPIEWFESCMERARSVGRITTPRNKGTGFLVKGADLNPNWGNEPVFVTNSHVTLDDDVTEMSVQFLATGSTDAYPVVERLKSSPPDGLDFAILRLARLPAGSSSAPLAERSPATPVAGSNERVYVVGHPNAGELSVSMYHSVLVSAGERTLHYVADTEPGSSGSPVFNEAWEVVGIHHGINNGFFADGVEYLAQEAIVFQAIMDMAILEPGPI